MGLRARCNGRLFPPVGFGSVGQESLLRSKASPCLEASCRPARNGLAMGGSMWISSWTRWWRNPLPGGSTAVLPWPPPAEAARERAEPPETRIIPGVTVSSCRRPRLVLRARSQGGIRNDGTCASDRWPRPPDRCAGVRPVLLSPARHRLARAVRRDVRRRQSRALSGLGCGGACRGRNSPIAVRDASAGRDGDPSDR
jgi:hypothetical protein